MLSQIFILIFLLYIVIILYRPKEEHVWFTWRIFFSYFIHIINKKPIKTDVRKNQSIQSFCIEIMLVSSWTTDSLINPENNELSNCIITIFVCNHITMGSLHKIPFKMKECSTE